MTVPSELASRSFAWPDRLWRVISSAYLTLFLFVLLAITLALTIIFPQLPASLEAGERARQLEALTSSYRELGPWLRQLGVFTIFDGLWLRLVAGLLAYNILLRLADHLRWLGAVWRPVTALPALRPGGAAARVVLTAMPQEALAAVQKIMRAHYPTVVVDAAEDRARVYGRRGAPGAAAGVLFTLSLLLVLAGLMVNATAGWYTVELPLMAGEVARFPFADGLEIAFNGFTDRGAGPDALVALTWTDGRRVELRPGRHRPARTDNLWIVLRGEGPVLVVRASSAGRPLPLQTLAVGAAASEEIRTPFPQTQMEQAFAIPERNLTFRTVSYDALPGQGIAGPVFLVEAYRGDEPTPAITQLVEAQAAFAVDDVTVELQRERYAVLVAVYAPGLILLVIAAVLLLAAALLAVGAGYAETWALLGFGRPTVAVVFRTTALWRPNTEAGRLLAAVEAAFPDAALATSKGKGTEGSGAIFRTGRATDESG
ncbi:MAG: cytochrome c biogenesis protein ResB [Anaerolineae bacterium]|nr:cytochrome c biogenesis protein ResB [Anaerolineae bacterium]